MLNCKDIRHIIRRVLNESKREDNVSIPYDPNINNGDKWDKYGGNFPVIRNGKKFYVSRSLAVGIYIYCKDRKGEYCVLANKRGKGTPNNQGKWTVPCGYLDYNETLEMAAQREAFEETGVKVPLDAIEMEYVDSGKFSDGDRKKKAVGRQDVSVLYSAWLDGTVDEYKTSKKNAEENEVDSIKWIPLSEIDKYDFAFNEAPHITEYAPLAAKKV